MPECRKGLDQGRHLRSGDFPDDAIIDNGVAVDEQVAKIDYPTKLRYARRQLRVNTPELGQCLRDDLELSLDSGAQQVVLRVFLKGSFRW